MRTFAAIPLPDDVRKSITDFVRECSNLHNEGVKYVLPSNWHLTLKFLGETKEEMIENLSRSFASIRQTSFTLSVKGTGMFDGSSGPRVLWVGAEPSDGLLRLHSEAETAVHRFGFPRDERFFAPHITIARAKGKIDFSLVKKIEQNVYREFGIFEVKSFALYKSDLSGRDPVYSILQEFPLS